MYGSILAEIHARWFSAIAESAARHIQKEASSLVPFDLADLGCGSGVLCSLLREQSRSIYGIDRSPEMIARCRMLIPSARFETGDILDADIPDSDVVVMAGEILSYAMSGEERTDADLERFFRMVHDHLRPNGLFLFDVLGPHDYAGKFLHEHPEYTIFSHVTAHHDIVTRTITSFLRRGDGYEKSVEVHRLRQFDPAALTSLLTRIGFTVRPLTHFDTTPVLPGRLAFECRIAQ